MKSIKTLLIPSVLFLLIGQFGCTGVDTQEVQKPNFIMILADDMGWADVGAFGSQIETPNLDQMAREGMKFTHFYSMGAMCSPTRAALLTGRYQHTVGVPELCNPNQREDVPPLHLDLDAVAMPEALKPHGYVSMLAGKWHLGYDSAYWPRKHGFDRYWGSLIGTPGYYKVKETYENETPVKVDGYFTDKITDKAVEFIRDNKDTTFFLYLAYNAPHYPFEAPQDLIDKYKKVFDMERFAIYAAMVEQMDTGIGRIFAELRQSGLDKNTFVFFATDNGPSAEPNKAYGLKGARISTGGLREHKFSMFEGGIRVPAIAWWPGQIEAGSTTGRVACVMDILPTYMDIVRDSSGTEFHGRSIMPLLRGVDQDIHEDLHWEDCRMWAVQKGNWKLVGRWWETKPYLFDLSQDIYEQNDLSDQHPELVEDLVRLHHEWQAKHYPNPFKRKTEGRPAYAYPQEQ